ncbi:hypothetical protein BD410DRAFT_791666 [Rickenella mellea]|uniref:Uncharacterized protein n=1 Tax=Rickenella mellea TaxID=50990 RepID=A0A4Y7PXN3_9AGAM|nr:hypothetical protein BD410DRAFT_791666 [Rickenella mellea]
MLATNSPAMAASFTSAARSRLGQFRCKTRSEAAVLFTITSSDPTPTPELRSLLAYVRSLYGAGMGFDSIGILTKIIRATSGLRWDEEGDMADVLAIIDADISQAIQSCREELASGYLRDVTVARQTLEDVRAALKDCQVTVERWGGEFPFERGAANAQGLRI